MENQNEYQETPKATSELKGLVRPEITIEELHELCELTVKLTELRQNECKHLCIENISPDILHGLITRMLMAKKGWLRKEDAHLVA